MRTRRERCAAAILAVLLLLGAASAEARESARAGPAGFHAFLASLRSEAETRGVSDASFDAVFTGMTPDLSTAAITRRQPGEIQPVGVYLTAQVTAARVNAGRAMMARWKTDLTTIERRYGVPASIIVAIWGLESAYGASAGSKDVIRSLATLASIGYRPDLYRAELLTALSLLQNGAVRRPELRGSWAGAMGQPQFMPSSFEAYAVDWDRDGRRDIWTSVPDALASIANFLSAQGWQAGRPWGFEVRLPPGFDLRPGRASYQVWSSRGVARRDAAAMPAEGEGILYFAAGASGPALLVTPNFEVLKTYNFSDAYALSVGELADRLDGRAAIQASWPLDPPISRVDRIALQASLADRGYPVDNREGRVSLALRDTIRAAQASLGLAPDGNPTAALLQALQAAAPK